MVVVNRTANQAEVVVVAAEGAGAAAAGAGIRTDLTGAPVVVLCDVVAAAAVVTLPIRRPSWSSGRRAVSSRWRLSYHLSISRRFSRYFLHLRSVTRDVECVVN